MFAFLDDLYAISNPYRASHVADVVAHAVGESTGVAANLDKTRVYNAAGGAAPAGIADPIARVHLSCIGWASRRPGHTFA